MSEREAKGAVAQAVGILLAVIAALFFMFDVDSKLRDLQRRVGQIEGERR